MGTISIKGLRLLGRHGVAEQERRVGNEFQIDISIDVPLSDRPWKQTPSPTRLTMPA